MKHVLAFLREWTLPVAMTTGTLVYLLFAYTPALDEIGDFFFPIFEEIFPYFMFAILL